MADFNPGDFVVIYDRDQDGSQIVEYVKAYRAGDGSVIHEIKNGPLSFFQRDLAGATLITARYFPEEDGIYDTRDLDGRGRPKCIIRFADRALMPKVLSALNAAD